MNVSPDVKKLADFSRQFTGYVVSHTRMFRSLGVEHLTKDHVVIEIGSSYGVATNLMAKKAKMVVGVETSKECVDKVRKSRVEVDARAGLRWMHPLSNYRPHAALQQARRDFGHVVNLR